LAAAGLPAVESGAFVSAKAIPQMAASDQVYAQLQRRPGVRYPALVPNATGLAAAIAAGVDEIAVFTAASETMLRSPSPWRAFVRSCRRRRQMGFACAATYRRASVARTRVASIRNACGT
jgi:hypothetical protein